MTQSLGRTIQLLICGLLCNSLLVARPIIEDFPQIDQRRIVGAEERCGTVALGSWVVWLAENGSPALLLDETPNAAHSPFASARISPEAQQTLSAIDDLCGGRGEIKLLRLVEGWVDYLHLLPDDSLRTVIHHYNLPNEALLRQLTDQNASVILFYGIYQKDAATGQLSRAYGHYTCLMGHTDRHLIANTYATNYRFNLNAIPMERLHPRDRYRPKGGESLVYLHYPKAEYPRYTFKSFAPQATEHALLQKDAAAPLFTNVNKVALLEGALAIWIGK
jgi:hypothetical protein